MVPSPWERRSFLRGMRQWGAVAREMSSGNQVRVGQCGATSRTWSSSSLSLHSVCASKLTGGNAYLRKAWGQLCARASVPREPSVREKYIWQWEDSEVEDRQWKSIWASPNPRKKALKFIKQNKKDCANGNHKKKQKNYSLFTIFSKRPNNLSVLASWRSFFGLLSEEIQDGIFSSFFGVRELGGLAMAEVEDSDICELLAAEVPAGDEGSTVSYRNKINLDLQSTNVAIVAM